MMFDPASVFQIQVKEDYTWVLTETGKVYTWGLGARGRLGLNDTDDRLYPNKVKFRYLKEEDSKTQKKKHRPRQFEWEYDRINEAKKRVNKMEDFEEMMTMHNFVSNSLKRTNGDNYMTQKIRRYSKDSDSDDSEGEIIVSELVMTTRPNSLLLSKDALNQNVILASITKVLVTQIACSNKHTLITTNTGAVYGWGSNDYHQLGFDNKDTKKPYIERPKKIFGALNKAFICKVECGDNHSVVLSKDGLVYGWGSNMEWQLGISNSDSQIVPRPKQLTCTGTYSKAKKCGIKIVRANGNYTLITTDNGKCFVSAPNSSTFLQVFINNGSGHISNCFLGPDYAMLIDSQRSVHFCWFQSKENRNLDRTAVKVLENSNYIGFCCNHNKIWALNSKRQAYIADIYNENNNSNLFDSFLFCICFI